VRPYQLRMSKKQAILDYFREHALERAGEPELRAIRADLQQRLGAPGATSLRYIASVLKDAGCAVQYADPYSRPALPEPYAARLDGALEFHDLASAERSLAKLDELYREYSANADREGVKLVASLAKQGKLRARSLAANPRVAEAKRREKEEIARWFQVWLETPDLFRDWLELRKASDEFRSLPEVVSKSENRSAS